MESIKKHILVVDDDDILRNLYQMLLEYHGYTSETAQNGREAVAKISQGNYDAVLLDYMMPGPNGVTILQRILRQHPLLPVVMITGQADSQIVGQALAEGARACLGKPFDYRHLAQILKESFETAPSEQRMTEPILPS
jgi:DNA-binding NtrC family response regulator